MKLILKLNLEDYEDSKTFECLYHSSKIVNFFWKLDRLVSAISNGKYHKLPEELSCHFSEDDMQDVDKVMEMLTKLLSEIPEKIRGE